MPSSKSVGLLLCLLCASAVSAQNINVVEKQALYFQTSSSAPVLSSSQSPFEFSAQSPTAAALSIPAGLSSFNLPANTGGDGGYKFKAFYSSKSALDAGYSNGTYAITPSGGSPITVNLTGDLYPLVPQVISGGTWQNGVLVIDPTQTTTLTLTTFTGYGSGAGSHEDVEVSADSQNDSYDNDQQVISVAFAGLSATASPVTTITIPAGSLIAGNIYQGSLTFDAVSSLTQSPATVGIFSTATYFYAVAKTATTFPPPVIVSQPVSQSVPLGDSCSFAAGTTYNGSGGVPNGDQIQYLWYFNGQQVDFNNTAKYSFNNAALIVKNVASSDVGAYTVVVVTSGGLVQSQAANLTIGTAGPVTVTAQPPPTLSVNTGSSFTIFAGVAGVGPLTFQWSLNGVAIQNANSNSYSFGSASANNAGTYVLTITGPGGIVMTNATTLTVNPVAGPPTITRQPVAQTLPAGATVAFNVVASAFPAITGYQWYFNVGSNTPVAISGATSSRYVLSNVQAANGGNYSCKVTNTSGVVATNQVLLTVLATSPAPGHLVNLSILSNVSGSLSMGFVLGGTGTSGSIPVLIRGVGPAIGPGTVFNVGGVMIDPTLSVVQQTDHTKSFSNAGWGSNQTAVTTADNATGAFALTNPASADSALVASLSGVGGGYSATVTGKTGDSGNALTEVYDASGAFSPTNPRLVNLSCLTNISAGSTLDVGFVIGGNTAKTVLVRASGPAIGPGTLFNVGGVMADPQIVVSASATANIQIASNAGWGGDAVITTVGNSLGAFAYANANSLDSAAIVTLEPGVPYAVQVNSASGGGGNVLVEIYDVNP